MDLDTYPEHDNPLIWPIITLLKNQPSGWRIHTLADTLKQQGILSKLDDDPDQDLFKRNFLLMNALYQLQNMLLPQQWLQVQAMDICLCPNPHDHQRQVDCNDPLRLYYLDWNNYHTDSETVEALLSQFWQRYREHINASCTLSPHSQTEAYGVLGLPADATVSQARRQWRKLALRWHPDRPNGDAEQFRRVCEAWQRIQ